MKRANPARAKESAQIHYRSNFRFLTTRNYVVTSLRSGRAEVSRMVNTVASETIAAMIT
jgi:hypothetical protein